MWRRKRKKKFADMQGHELLSGMTAGLLQKPAKSKRGLQNTINCVAVEKGS